MGTVEGAGQGLGKIHQHFWACQKNPGPTLSQGQVFRAGVPLDPKLEPDFCTTYSRTGKPGVETSLSG